jgi:hypothetical protein
MTVQAGISVVATPSAAGAPLPKHNDNPAAPNTGRPFLRCLRRATFACDIAVLLFSLLNFASQANMQYFQCFNKRQKLSNR